MTNEIENEKQNEIADWDPAAGDAEERWTAGLIDGDEFFDEMRRLGRVLGKPEVQA
jgi:hypothetical protein